MKKVSFYTLGCKLNQAETSYLIDKFNKRDYKIVPFGEPSDVCVINTCTVTAKTEYRCRQIIRKAININAQAIIVVVGCYAQLSPNALKKISEVDLILGSDEKFKILEYLDNNFDLSSILYVKGKNENYIPANPGIIREQTRAFLKIQDGCNNCCSYCIVPHVRGRSRSDSMEHILSLTKQAVNRGYKEIVLTGVHIGSYGNDLIPQVSLLDLLKKLTTIPKLGRIRLSSLEPLEVSDELIEFVSLSDKICSHFHIPLQSGDNFTLKNMKRNYTVSKYVKIINKLTNKIPEFALGTDIIVGFPGESEERFNNTYQLVQDLPFTYMHVFSFSPRPGTEAAKLTDQINPIIKKERSARLIKLGRQKKYYFYRQAINRQFQVLFESKANGEWMYGFTENYIRIKARQEPSFFNKIVPVRVNNVIGDFALGEILI